jgi:hypothetical protein
MGDRELNASIGPERRATISRDYVRNILRNGLLGIVAIAVVVATHFGYPVIVMQLTAGLPLTSVGIGMFLLALISVAVIPISITVFVLEELENRFCTGRNVSVRRWPWGFAIPSILGVVSLLLVPYWLHLLPANHMLTESIASFDTGVSSWIIGGVAALVVIAEFGSGAVLEFGSSDGRESTNTSQSDREPTRVTDISRSRNPRDDDVTRRDQFDDDTVYNWVQPPAFGFESVGGFDKVKDDLYQRVIRPHKSEKESYQRFRVSPPTGILLYGPPGTGKTYLARAIAGELGSPYVELSQADLTSMWINESPAKVRRLFEEADRFDFCVIFIDEIDGLVRSRGSNAHNEDSKVVSEFLARLADEDSNYLIIAATNRPDQMDTAVLRPGRFDEQFEIGLPDDRERIEIFKVQLRGRNPSLSASDYHEIGERSEGYTAADITAIVERAAFHAAERDANSITIDDLLSSFP